MGCSSASLDQLTASLDGGSHINASHQARAFRTSPASVCYTSTLQGNSKGACSGTETSRTDTTAAIGKEPDI
jgi:hypothetical protein